MLARMYYSALASGGMETGASGSAGLSSAGGAAVDPYSITVQAGAEALDIFAGGPQKRERTAKYGWKEAQAAAEAARLQLEAAKAEGASALELARLQHTLAQESAAMAAQAPTGGLRAEVPGVGVPVWQVVAAVGLVVVVVAWP